MVEYKSLKRLAEYLLSSGKTLDMYGLPELSTYIDVSVEVARDSAESVDVLSHKK